MNSIFMQNNQGFIILGRTSKNDLLSLGLSQGTQYFFFSDCYGPVSSQS